MIHKLVFENLGVKESEDIIIDYKQLTVTDKIPKIHFI